MSGIICTSPQALYYGNDHMVTLPEVVDEDDVAVETATVSFEVFNSSGTSLGSGSMTHTTGGTYEGVLESSVFSSVAINAFVRIVITLVYGSANARWVERRKVLERPYSASS